MERCSISEPTALLRLLLVVAGAVVVVSPPPCRAADEPADMQLPVTPQATPTPTPLWAVDWGPTQPLEDETHHFLSSQEFEGGKQATPEAWPRRRNAQTNQTQQQPLSIDAKDSGEEQERDAEEREIEEVMTAACLSVLPLCPSPSRVPWPRRIAGTHFRAPLRSQTEKDFPWSIFEELTVPGSLITSSGHGM